MMSQKLLPGRLDAQRLQDERPQHIEELALVEAVFPVAARLGDALVQVVENNRFLGQALAVVTRPGCGPARLVEGALDGDDDQRHRTIRKSGSLPSVVIGQ